MIVTISRFSTSDIIDTNSIQSLIEYFGQPPLVFNYGVFPITKHTYGIFSFGGILKIFNLDHNVSQSAIGGRWGSGFYTYVGPIYIDFGFIGVLLHAILISRFLIKLLRKKVFSVSSMFLIFLIYQYLLKGAFVIGSNYIIGVLMNLLIYMGIKLIENLKLREDSSIFVNFSMKRTF
jgi:oligosaccharide repeat unit polymerase